MEFIKTIKNIKIKKFVNTNKIIRKKLIKKRIDRAQKNEGKI